MIEERLRYIQDDIDRQIKELEDDLNDESKRKVNEHHVHFIKEGDPNDRRDE